MQARGGAWAKRGHSVRDCRRADGKPGSRHCQFHPAPPADQPILTAANYLQPNMMYQSRQVIFQPTIPLAISSSMGAGPADRRGDRVVREIGLRAFSRSARGGHHPVGRWLLLGCLRDSTRTASENPQMAVRQAARPLRRYRERASRVACSVRATPPIGTQFRFRAPTYFYHRVAEVPAKSRYPPRSAIHLWISGGSATQFPGRTRFHR
jgi:hypothetical protein